MAVLVTGAFGFVGSYLSGELKTKLGIRLIAVDIAAPLHHNYDEFHTWKQLYNIDWQNIDTIIHLAGKAHDTENNTEELTYFEINLGLTQKIFDYYLKSSATKFIFFSSVKAVADSVNGRTLTEDFYPAPKTPYGKSKLAAEAYLLNQPKGTNKKIYILRPSMIHGPGNKGNLNLLYKFAQHGIPWPLGKFHNKRSFSSIDNLVFVISLILTQDIKQGIYNMSDDELISTNRLIELIAESQGKEARIWCFNKTLICKFAQLGDIFHLSLNSERLKKLTESYMVSNIKLKKALGIEKMPVTSEAGMKKTLSSF